VLDLKLRAGMTRMLKRAKEEPADMLEMEFAELGVHHAEVGSLALQRWGMPELLRTAVLYHHTDALPVEMPLKARLLTSVVSAADFVCWTQGMGSLEARRPPLLPKEAQLRINLNGDAVSKISATIDREIQAMAEIFHFSAPDAARFRNALQRANLELGRINTLYEEARRQLERRVKELTELNEAIHKARQTLNAEKIPKAMIEAVCSGFGIDRAIYFNIDLETNMVEGVATVDSTSVSTDITKLRFTYVPTEPFLSMCKQAVHPFRFTAQDPATIGSKILRYLDAPEMIVVPIMVQGEMRGLVIADNGISRNHVSDPTIVSLGVLASETGMAIENASLYQKVKQLSTTDELTRIFNRRQLADALTYEMDRSRRYQRPLSTVMCDLDHFKSFNDNYGHLAGDKLLREIARLIKATSRDVDIVARYGGEEFVVVLPETPKDNAIIYAERVRKAVERFGIGCKHYFPKVTVSISIGVGGFEPAQDKTMDDLIGKADKALYAAKQRGRNMVCVDGQ
jgi:diguanylate cyclase (GGDEF)-like protein